LNAFAAHLAGGLDEPPPGSTSEPCFGPGIDCRVTMTRRAAAGVLLRCPHLQGFRPRAVSEVGRPAMPGLRAEHPGRQRTSPRFVKDEEFDGSVSGPQKTRASIGYEWTHFTGLENFRARRSATYFSNIRTLEWTEGPYRARRRFCGHGPARPARFTRRSRIPSSRSAFLERDQRRPARKVADSGRICASCVQGDSDAVCRCPTIRSTSCFRLGVLHHISGTTERERSGDWCGR
jgi:hypothetical protein